MGFLKKFQLGKVLGAAGQGFAQGGVWGAVLQGGKQAAISGVKAGMAKARNYGTVTPAGSPAMFNVAGSFMPSYSGVAVGGDTMGVPVAARMPALSAATGDIYNSLMTILQRMGAAIRSPNSVIPMGKRVLSRVIATARRVPGMTPVGMLVTLGLTEMAANQLITWYTTAGKRRRRIRVTNIKALNRSVRRLEGFTRLARRVEASLGRRSVVRSSRRCRKCKKSPCGC